MQEIKAQTQANILSLLNYQAVSNFEYLTEKINNKNNTISSKSEINISNDNFEISLNSLNTKEKNIDHHQLQQTKDLNNDFTLEEKFNFKCDNQIQRKKKKIFTLTVDKFENENDFENQNMQQSVESHESHQAQPSPLKNKSFSINPQSNQIKANYKINQTSKEINQFNFTNSLNEEENLDEIKRQKVFVISKIKKPKNWTKEEDEILINLAFQYKQKSWTKVAKEFQNKTSAQCRARFKRIRPGIIKGPWSHNEDKLITALVNKQGKNWALISKNMSTRNGKQIRDRFLNYLDPSINKNKFSEEEDSKVIKYYKEYGPKWSLISQHFSGRTGDMIKNRFHSCLRKKIHLNEVFKVKNKIKRSLKIIRNSKKKIKSEKKEFCCGSKNLMECDLIEPGKEIGNFSFEQKPNFGSLNNIQKISNNAMVNKDIKKNEYLFFDYKKKINFWNNDIKKDIVNYENYENFLFENNNSCFLHELKFNNNYNKNQHQHQKGECFSDDLKNEKKFSLNYLAKNDNYHKNFLNRKRNTDKDMNFQQFDNLNKNNFNKESKIIKNKTANSKQNSNIGNNKREKGIDKFNENLNLKEDPLNIVTNNKSATIVFPNLIKKEIFENQSKQKNYKLNHLNSDNKKNFEFAKTKSNQISNNKEVNYDLNRKVNSNTINDKSIDFNFAKIAENIFNFNLSNVNKNLYETIAKSLDTNDYKFSTKESPWLSETNISNINNNIYNIEFPQCPLIKNITSCETNENLIKNSDIHNNKNNCKDASINNNNYTINNKKQLLINILNQNAIINNQKSSQQANPIQNSNHQIQNEFYIDNSNNNYFYEDLINWINREIYSQQHSRINAEIDDINQKQSNNFLFNFDNNPTNNSHFNLNQDSEFYKFLINFVNHLHSENIYLNQFCLGSSILNSDSDLYIQTNSNLNNFNDENNMFNAKNQTLNPNLNTLNLYTKIVEMQRNFNDNINFTYMLMLENIRKSLKDCR